MESGPITHLFVRRGHGRILPRRREAVSRPVHDKRQIGAPLLQRNTDGVSLTEKGMAFYHKAQAVITANDEAESWLSRNYSVCQTIRFATTDCYASRLLPGVLQHWKEQFPEVKILVECGYSPDIWERFRRDEIDIALAQHCPSDINADLVRVEPLDWVCARQSLAWQRNPVPVALFEQGCPDREIMLSGLKCAGKDYKLGFETFNYAGLVAAVESGTVISALPRSTIPSSLKSLGAEHGLPRLPSLNVKLACQRANADSVCKHFYESIAFHLQAEQCIATEPAREAV